MQSLRGNRGSADNWTKELRERTFRDRVNQDLETGRESGVTGTPTFFMNGIRYRGDNDLQSMLAAIQREAPGSIDQRLGRKERER